MRFIKFGGLLLGILSLKACISMKESTSVKSNGFEQGISVVHGLPKTLSGGSSPIPGVPYLFCQNQLPRFWGALQIVLFITGYSVL